MYDGFYTGVATSWYAERAGKRGIIAIDDFDLGNLHGGAEGFTAELNRQGFTAVHILKTRKELASASAKCWEAPGTFGGPWGSPYSWCPNPTQANGTPENQEPGEEGWVTTKL